ncbi:MAG: S8 family serine peptidase [Coriobacteriia bacterium]|nr:S8 family serine peptidase [Coriobacteriia bacterium]
MKRSAALVAILLVVATFAVRPLAATAAFSASTPSIATMAASQQPQSLGVVVMFEDALSAASSAQSIQVADGTEATAVNTGFGVYTLSTPSGLTDAQYASELLASPNVKYAEPNYILQSMTYTPPTESMWTDTTMYAQGVYTKSWWLRSVKADGAWALGNGDTYPLRGTANDVKVGVIDTGVYLTSPDFAGGNVIGKWDYCDSVSFETSTNLLTVIQDSDVTPSAPSVPPDDSTHGTAVASIIGSPVDGIGTIGVGWNPTVYVYKDAGLCTTALNGYVAGQTCILESQLIAAIIGAADDGCRVISISQGGYGRSDIGQAAVNYAWGKGAVVVASAGNNNSSTPVYPAAYNNVVSVASVGIYVGSVRKSSFSSYGPSVDICAPGEAVYAATPSGDTAFYGTSASAPVAAGAIAYIWRGMPSMTNAQVVALVQNTATDLGTAGRDDLYGYGEVNMEAAYRALVSPPTLVSVYRSYNMNTGTHFYTASEDEKNTVLANYSSVYRLEGAAYSINSSNAANNVPLYRFYNMQTGTHFYTSSEDEKNSALANYPTVFRLEGVAYYVSMTPANALTVYRFYNVQTGTHFYTASDLERNNVIANYPGIYSYEGVAYYVGQ